MKAAVRKIAGQKGAAPVQIVKSDGAVRMRIAMHQTGMDMAVAHRVAAHIFATDADGLWNPSVECSGKGYALVRLEIPTEEGYSVGSAATLLESAIRKIGCASQIETYQEE